MAAVTATLTKVKSRLILSGSGPAAEPDDTAMTSFIREAYGEVLGRLDLPRKTTATVVESDDRYTTSITADKVYFLGFHQKMLIPAIEYAWSNPTVHFVPGIVITDDEVWAWIKPTLDLTASSIDTSCAHGPDWLEPAVIWRAEMLCLSRLSRGSGSTGAAQSGPHYRSLEVGYEAMLKGMQQIHADWMGMQTGAIQARLSIGDHPLFQAPYATIRERSGGRRRNRATGNI